ncbi:MAG: hypothetical protein QW692_05820, partial [Nitrososphaerota archaeon]
MMEEREIEVLFILAIRDFGREDRRNEIHLTDLTSECFRKVWFEKKSPYPEDIDGIFRLWEGKALHEASKIFENHEMVLELEGVKTRIDEYGNGVLVEKKFVTFMPRDLNDLKKYYQHYIMQVSLEALFLVENGYQFKQAFLLFYKRGEKDERERPVKAFDVTGMIDLEQARALFQERKKQLEEILSASEPPEIPP